MNIDSRRTFNPNGHDVKKLVEIINSQIKDGKKLNELT